MEIMTRIKIGAVELGEHQFLLGVRSESSVSTSCLATLVDTDQEKFHGASAIVDGIGPPAKWVRTAFLDSAGYVVEIDDASAARFVRIGGGDSAGAPSSRAFGINCFKTVLQCLFHWLLHGVQIDFTVALDVNIGVECKLECLGDRRHPDAIGIDT